MLFNKRRIESLETKRLDLRVTVSDLSVLVELLEKRVKDLETILDIHRPVYYRSKESAVINELYDHLGIYRRTIPHHHILESKGDPEKETTNG